MSTAQGSDVAGMLNILFAGGDVDWPKYAPHLRAAFAGLEIQANLLAAAPDPALVDYVIYAPSSGLQDFSPFTGLKAVLGLWAGVETIAGNATIEVPLCRMVDTGLTEGMVEWVTGHVLRHHLGMDAFVTGQDGIWRQGNTPPLARDRQVGILGLGALGTACAQALGRLNFPVSGWSRTAKHIEGISCLRGDEGLGRILTTSDILVLLLPQTADTENLLNAARLSLLPRGAVIINPGRGTLIDDAALIVALDSGAIHHATLDVFRTEPLPAGHPFWAHPGVTVTPHIASDSRAASAARTIVRNIARGESGKPLHHVVDRQRGY